MHMSDRKAQIQRFIERLNADPSLAQQLKADPSAALRTAGFDASLAGFLPDVVGYSRIPECLDPPETNHYTN